MRFFCEWFGWHRWAAPRPFIVVREDREKLLMRRRTCKACGVHQRLYFGSTSNPMPYPMRLP
jgi:hypothetical protein